MLFLLQQNRYKQRKKENNQTPTKGLLCKMQNKHMIFIKDPTEETNLAQPARPPRGVGTTANNNGEFQ